MSILKGLSTAAVLTAGLMAASPSAAVLTSFAGYSQIGANSISFTNVGTGNRTNATNGTTGTVSNSASTVNFYFLNNSLVSLGNIVANFTFTSSAPAAASQTPIPGNPVFLNEVLPTGSFSFTAAANHNSAGCVYCFAMGANLLSGTFTKGNVGGFSGSSSGSLTASAFPLVNGATVNFTSDLLIFQPASNGDLAISLTNITRTLLAANGKALRSFKATSSGTFSNDPAPAVIGIPEPEVWGLLVVGFGMVGLQVRRRSRSASIAA